MMENLESQNQNVELSTKIKSIYDKFDIYYNKRGSEEDAIDMINSDLVFSDESVFAGGGKDSFELVLDKINSSEEQLEGEFRLLLSDNLDYGVVLLIEDYIGLLEINYQIKLNIQDIESLVQQVVNMIEGFVLINRNNYKIDLGDENLIVMSGWENIYLDNEKKRQYIKGSLLKFEDNSEYITKVSRKDDIYILHSQDGSEVRLYIRSKRLVLESDFIYTAKLSKYREALNQYLLKDIIEKFSGAKKDTVTTVSESKHMVRRNLLDVISTSRITSLFDKNVWYKEDEKMRSERINKMRNQINRKEVEKPTIIEDIRGNPIISDEEKQSEIQDNTESDNTSELIISEEQLLEKKLEGKERQLADIVISCLEHIKKKKITINSYKERGIDGKTERKLDQLDKVKKYLINLDLLEIYKYYKENFWKDELNISFLKNIINTELDIHFIGLYHYLKCGDTIVTYKTLNEEATHDIGYSSDGLNIYATISKEGRGIYNTQLDTYESRSVKRCAIRRYARNKDITLTVEGTQKNDNFSTYNYKLYHMNSKQIISSFDSFPSERLGLTRRCVYDLVDNYSLIIGDKKLRYISIGDTNSVGKYVSVLRENYTMATESSEFFNYSEDKCTVYNLKNGRELDIIFSMLLGDGVSVQHMHARKGQVKIIYIQDNQLKYVYYKEKDLIKNKDKARILGEYDITSINSMNLYKKIQGAELFFSEDNKYAIFVKDDTIYTLKFTNYGIKLFITKTLEINHIFRVKFAPNKNEAILRDGNVIYRLDLDLIEELQTDETEEGRLKLLAKRKKLVDQFQYIADKKRLEDMEEERKLLEGRKNLVQVLQNHCTKEERQQEILDIGFVAIR